MDETYGRISVNGLYVCPICGLVSNLHPDYITSEGTEVVQRLVCNHKVDGRITDLRKGESDGKADRR